MSVLEQVITMKKEGISDENVISSLKEQGISPKEVHDALSQAKIKSAISDEQDGAKTDTEGMEPSIMGSENDGTMMPQRAGNLPTEGEGPSEEELTPPRHLPHKGFSPMTREVSEESVEEYKPKLEKKGKSQTPQQMSMVQEQEEEIPMPSDEYIPQPSDASYSQDASYPQDNQQQYPQEYQQYPQDASYYDYGTPVTSTEYTDTLIKISEQVFLEKIKPLEKQIDELIEFKTLTQSKVESMSDRLKRIENVIDRLQASILEKVGGYGSGIENVKKELSMMQDSFGKVVNNLVDKANSKHTHSIKPTHTTHHIEKKTTVVHKSSPKKKGAGKKKSKKKKK